MESQKNKKGPELQSTARKGVAAKTGKGRKAQKNSTLGGTSQPKVLKKAEEKKQQTSKDEIIAGGYDEHAIAAYTRYKDSQRTDALRKQSAIIFALSR